MKTRSVSILLALLLASGAAWAGVEGSAGIGRAELLPGGSGGGAPPATESIPPDAVSKLTASSGDLEVTLEWANPGDADFSGTVVLARQGSAVTDAPVDGVSYSVGDTVGSSRVACVTSAVDLSCVDTAVTNAATYYYSVFAHDTFLNYSSPSDTVGHPRSATEVRWSFTTGATALAPVGVIPMQNVVGIGNDKLLHRFDALDGTRGGWTSPLVGGAVQDRPMVGDLNPGGAADLTAFFTSQNGRVYRYSLDDGTATYEGSADAITDAGCASGLLQASPVVILDAFDSNANNADDVVVTATRCGATDNKILLYSHDLATLHDTYDGGADGLGISNAAPLVIYRNTANNLVFVPVRSDGNESLVALEIASGPAFGTPPFAVVTGIGDIDARPAMVRRSSDRFILLGNTAGELYLYATVRDGSSLRLLDSYTAAASDGPVKGIAVGTGFRNASGLYENWFVWTTDTLVHGMKIGADGRFKASSYWSTALAAPSKPLVLRWVGGTSNTLAYIGAGDGTLYELDASDGSVNRSFSVETGKTVGDPSFDYNDGTSQGLVVGTSSGAFYRVNLD